MVMLAQAFAANSQDHEEPVAAPQVALAAAAAAAAALQPRMASPPPVLNMSLDAFELLFMEALQPPTSCCQ